MHHNLIWITTNRQLAVYGLCLSCLFLIGVHSLSAAQKPLPDLKVFLQQVKEKMLEQSLAKDLLENYAYRKRVVEEKLKNDRSVKKTDVREYEVYHLKEGSYEKLIAKNGVPLCPQELKKQDEEQAGKQRKQLERDAALSRKERQGKADQSQKERRERIEDIFAAFHFEPQGREVLNGRPAIVLRFRPRPEARLESRIGKMALKKVAGKVWFEENEHVPMKVEVETFDNITLGGGLLAKIDKGTEFIQEWRPVNRDWLPKRTEMRAHAKVLMLKGFHLRRLEEYSDYQKLTVEAAAKF